MRMHVLRLNTPVSLAGLPAITVPVLLENGRSSGVQLIAKEEYLSSLRKIVAAIPAKISEKNKK